VVGEETTGEGVQLHKLELHRPSPYSVVRRCPTRCRVLQACQDRISGISFSGDGKELAVACEDRVLRVFRIEDVVTKHFTFKRKELVRDLVDVAFGAGGDLFVLSKVTNRCQG
jgi:WD40 repeat protein